METRRIDAAEITAAVKKLFMDINYNIGCDILDALKSAKENEINCLYVLKLTRHRGIGTYLFTQSVSALLKRYKNVRVSETLYQDRKILQDFINIFDHKNYVFLDLNIKGNPNCRTN